MFRFHCKRLIQIRRHGEILKRLQNPSFKYLSSISGSTKDSSFTVAFLVESCGLSPETAFSVAKKVHLESEKKPDSVLKLFENYGFTKPQIANLITKRPLLLVADPVKTLEPQILFLSQAGLLGPKLTKILSSDPNIFTRSLEKQIIPAFNFLKTLLRTDEKFSLVINRSTASWIFQFNVLKAMEPKIAILRDHGVNESNISKMVMLLPLILTLSSNRFNELVREISDVQKASLLHGYLREEYQKQVRLLQEQVEP